MDPDRFAPSIQCIRVVRLGCQVQMDDLEQLPRLPLPDVRPPASIQPLRPLPVAIARYQDHAPALRCEARTANPPAIPREVGAIAGLCAASYLAAIFLGALGAPVLVGPAVVAASAVATWLAMRIGR